MTSADSIRKLKGSRKIAAVTAYNYPHGALAARAGMDAVLAGDSMGMTVMGHGGTTLVEADDIVRAAQWVRRGIDAAAAEGAQAPLLLADVPLKAMKPAAEARANAVRIAQEGKADAVKLEGGAEAAELVAGIAAEGVPVMAHIGLRPQQIEKFGGFKVQGKTNAAAEALLQDARALCDAGAFAVLLELVAPPVAARLTAALPVPTVGIGSGAECDGQIQVLHDLLGLTIGRRPRHAALYMEGGRMVEEALGRYASDVRQGRFEPSAAEPEGRA